MRWMWQALIFAMLLVIAAPTQSRAQDAKTAALEKRAAESFKANRYPEAFSLSKEWAEAAEKAETVKGKLGSATANALGNLAWYALFAKQPEQALTASGRAVALAPEMLWLQTNRAHALLFSGQTNAAIKAYLDHKGEIIPDNGKWEEVILKDFAEFRSHGLNHPDLARVEKTLAEAPESAQAQDLDALNKQIEGLTKREKFVEAAEIAKRALTLAEQKFGIEHPYLVKSLHTLAFQYVNQSRLADAEAILKRAIFISDKALGPDHPDIEDCVFLLAQIYSEQLRNAEAEQLLRHLLETKERVSGKNDPGTLMVVRYLAMFYKSTDRYDEAEKLYKRVLETREHVLGPENPDTLASMNDLALFYDDIGRESDGEGLFKRSLEVEERVFGKDHPGIFISLNNLARLYANHGRYREAEQIFKRVLERVDLSLDEGLPLALVTIDNLATLYNRQGRYTEAEPLYKRSLEASERLLGKEHPDTLLTVNNLTTLYLKQDRYDEAEMLLSRLVEANERVFGRDHSRTLISVANLAFLYEERDRPAEAIVLYKRVVETRERLRGKDDPDVLVALDNLAKIYTRQSHYADAEQLYKRVLEARARALGKENDDTLITENNLAVNYFAQGDWLNAAQLWRRTTAAIAKFDQRDAQDIGQGPAGKRESSAQRYTFQFRNLLKALSRLAPEGEGADGSASREMFATAQWATGSEAAQSLAQMAARGARGNPALAVLIRERQDLMAEWHKRDASRNAAFAQHPEKLDRKAEAKNLERIAAIDMRIAELDQRLSAEFPDYAGLANPAPLSVEDVQTQLRSDEALVLFLDTQISDPTPEETFIWVVTKTDLRWVRSQFGTIALSKSVKALRCALDTAAWDGGGAGECAELLGVPVDQALKAGKALPFDAARAQELFKELFGRVEDLIKGKHLLIVPSGPLTQLPFQVLVQSLPKGVPAGAQSREVARIGVELKDLSGEDRGRLLWNGEGGVRIVKVLEGTPAAAAGLKANDIVLAAGGEKAFATGQTTNAIRAHKPGSTAQFSYWREGEKHVVSIVLGTTTLREWKPLYWDATNARDIRWLVRDHAITVLPAVSSLKALRRVAKPSAAKKPMIGFGNPLLDGPDDRYAERAQLARAKQSCRGTPLLREASLFGSRAGVAPVVLRGGIADVAFLRRAPPLPETADELCAVARDLGADPSEIRLGARATEREVKRLSASGDLAQYRIVHFATHGALAGQVSGSAEPGLVLTPPDAASEEDDGYLTASEIAGLKLDADWVILSACNTAAGGAQGAEALSGLARAFFYAQARALLVSHWEVNSDSTVKLIVSAIGALRRHPRIGRAEALRRAMLAMIDHGKPKERHPSYWAPFVLVGEGGASK